MNVLSNLLKNKLAVSKGLKVLNNYNKEKKIKIISPWWIMHVDLIISHMADPSVWPHRGRGWSLSWSQWWCSSGLLCMTPVALQQDGGVHHCPVLTLQQRSVLCGDQDPNRRLFNKLSPIINFELINFEISNSDWLLWNRYLRVQSALSLFGGVECMCALSNKTIINGALIWGFPVAIGK